MKSFSFKKKFKEERGVTLYIAILILSAVVLSASAISIVFIGQFKISGDIGRSMKAIYSASSGLEAALFEIRQNSDGSRVDCTGLGVSLCNVVVDEVYTGADCGFADCTKIESTGQNVGFYRKMQAVYKNQ